MSQDPKNPRIPPGHKTPSHGRTRTTLQNGLEWFDISLDQWRPAVRQHMIRDRLIQQQVAFVGDYTHPRGHNNGNDRRAPLASDLNDGGDWVNRPARLFQLDATRNQYRREPTTVLMDGNRVMLDPFDHPIRDFGNDLPVVLSSRMRGWEIENDTRRNLAIHYYDLIARCPDPPPYPNTIRERATKFREASGCLAWEARPGSDGIRNYILGLLPAGATTTASLGRDLTRDQLAARKAVNAGKNPNRRRKAKREAEAQGATDNQNADRVATGRVAKQSSSQDPRRRPDSNIDDDLSASQGPRRRPTSNVGNGSNASQNSRRRPDPNMGIDLDTRQPRRRPAPNSGDNRTTNQHRPMEEDRQVLGNTRRRAADDDTTLTPAEHAAFLAQWRSNVRHPAAEPNASLRHPPVNRNPNVLVRRGTPQDTSMIAAPTNAFNYNDRVPQGHQHPIGSYQNPPRRRRRPSPNMDEAEDNYNRPVSAPRVRKRARNETLPESNTSSNYRGVRDESLLGSSSSSGGRGVRDISLLGSSSSLSGRGVRDEPLLGSSTNSSAETPNAKRRRTNAHAYDRSASDEDDYLEYTPEPSPPRPRTISDSEPRREAERRTVVYISSDDEESFNTEEQGASRQESFGGRNGSEEIGQAEFYPSPATRQPTSSYPHGARRSHVQQASSHNIAAPPPPRGSSSTHRSRGAMASSSNVRYQSRPNANPMHRSGSSASSSGASQTSHAFFNSANGALPRSSQPARQQPRNSLDLRECVYYDPTMPQLLPQSRSQDHFNESFYNPFQNDQGPPFEFLDPDGGLLFDDSLPDPYLGPNLLDPINFPPLDMLASDQVVHPGTSDGSNLSTPLTISPPSGMANFNHEINPAFQAEAARRADVGDVRYIFPDLLTDHDTIAMNEALRLTRLDFQQRLPNAHVPDELTFYGEIYASQQRHLQEAFEQYWPGPEAAPMLYQLGEWRGGLEDWQMGIRDDEGRRLLREVQDMDAQPKE